MTLPAVLKFRNGELELAQIEKMARVRIPVWSVPHEYFSSLSRIAWGAEPAILVGLLSLLTPIGILYTYVIKIYHESKRCMALVTAPLSCTSNEVIMSIGNKKDIHSHRYMTTFLVFEMGSSLLWGVSLQDDFLLVSSKEYTSIAS